MNQKLSALALMLSVLVCSASAQSTKADTNNHAQTSQTVRVFILNHDIESQGVGEQIGTVEFSDSDTGLVIQTALSFLSPGEHGFHVHENPSCEFKMVDEHLVPGLSAGGHYD